MYEVVLYYYIDARIDYDTISLLVNNLPNDGDEIL